MMMPFSRAASRAPVTGGSVVVRPIAGNVDDAPQPAIRILFEQIADFRPSHRPIPSRAKNEHIAATRLIDPPDDCVASKLQRHAHSFVIEQGCPSPSRR
jgi:hypothetical protein